MAWLATSWLVRRKMRQDAARLGSLRVELAQVDQQLEIIRGDADDLELRAVVADTTAAAREATDARKHAAALGEHRRHVRAEIERLERRQDELLDRLADRRQKPGGR